MIIKSVVIHAKAGTGSFAYRAVRVAIPAFAGMTSALDQLTTDT